MRVIDVRRGGEPPRTGVCELFPRGVRDLADALRDEPSALFVDIDGTISPIVPRPEDAVVLPECRDALRRLAGRLHLLCVLSGRPADVAWRMVQVDEALYVGNHGLETWWRGELLRPAGIERYHAPLARARDMLRLELADVSGLVFEDKHMGFAIHHRDAPESANRVLTAARRIAAPRGLAVCERTAHVEVRAPIEGDKGTALGSLAKRHDLRGIVVAGDDQVDLPAFRAARAHAHRPEGVRARIVTVGPAIRGQGDVSVDSPAELGVLLTEVAEALER